jgi:hypothetical protein
LYKEDRREVWFKFGSGRSQIFFLTIWKGTKGSGRT